MEIIEDRHARRSTIFVSQLPVAALYDVFPEQTIADAILDHNNDHVAKTRRIKDFMTRKKGQVFGSVLWS